MRRLSRVLVVGGAFALLVSACAAPVAPPPASTGPEPERAAAPATRSNSPRRIVAAIQGAPRILSYKVDSGSAGGTPGVDVIEELTNAGAVSSDQQGNLRAQLLEAVPTIENGLWRLLPDGRMTTTHRLRPDVTWHDGAPLTSDDLLFTAQVSQDRELAAFADKAFSAIESVEASDARTVVITWKQAFIDSDTMFSRLANHSLPLPRHLLFGAYQERKATFTELPYWTDEFVGLGPFMVKEFVRGSHMVLQANDRYVLGRPKVDEIELKFFADSNTVIANVLAGTVELTLGRGLSLEQVAPLRTQWQVGKVDFAFVNWLAIYPQFLNPTPAVIGNVQFRRALMHATDRQALADTLMSGLVPVADSYLSPQSQEYQEVGSQIVRYEFDPRRAGQLIEGLGYSRAGDGTYGNTQGKLNIELRTSAQLDIQRKALLAVADQWQSAGIGVEPVEIPNQRIPDREYRATMPGFELVRQPNDAASHTRAHSSLVPLPENNFAGVNRARYRSAELDALSDRFQVTIPSRERMDVLGQIIHHMTDQVVWMGLFYEVDPHLVGSRLINVTPRGQMVTQAWNAAEWDVR